MSRDSKKLAGKVAVVTGASKGIGAGIARALAEAGASVVINYASSKDAAERLVSEIASAGGKALAVKANVAREADVVRLFDEANKAFGRLDVLVNNAGMYGFAPLAEVTEDQYRAHFDLNVLGLILSSREAARRFGPEGGSIVNIGSTITSITPPNSVIYTATKGAVDAITRTLAKELGPRRIRVNSVNPGMVETEGVHASGLMEGDMRRSIEGQTPLGRIGQVADIAPVAVFLASPESGWITGEVVRVAGGLR
jgi:3-oxoacyl-[acyl-carrier protein] reductase